MRLLSLSSDLASDFTEKIDHNPEAAPSHAPLTNQPAVPAVSPICSSAQE